MLWSASPSAEYDTWPIVSVKRLINKGMRTTNQQCGHASLSEIEYVLHVIMT
jgi:hypothetical protein